MGRNVKPGITFYRMDSGHILNKKVRLLCNEFDSDGYYIWSSLLDKAYAQWGYYFDMNDPEELGLFASEYCKKKLTLVKEVIAGCIRRGLFDKAVAGPFGILTSQMMQEVFLYATAERRRQGSIFEMRSDWLKIDFGDKIPVNIKIVHVNEPDSLREESTDKTRLRQDKTKQNNFATGDPSPPKKILKVKNEEKADPYWDSLVQAWFNFGIEKFNVKPSFERDDPKILKRIIQRLRKRAEEKKIEWDQDNALKRLRIFLDMAFSDKWLSENFLLTNLEKQFDKIIQNQAKKHSPPVADLNYLFDRYCEGDLDKRMILPKHFEDLKKTKSLSIERRHIQQRMNQLIGSNEAKIAGLYKDYEEGRSSNLTEEDKPVLMRLAVIDYFEKIKTERLQLTQ